MNERIKDLRKALGLTLEEFGNRVGLGKSAVSRMEKGINGVTDQTILSVCREFGASEEWIRTGAGEMLRQDNSTVLTQLAKEYALDDLDKAIVEAYLQLPATQRAAVKAFVAGIAAKLPQQAAVPGAPSTQ